MQAVRRKLLQGIGNKQVLHIRFKGRDTGCVMGNFNDLPLPSGSWKAYNASQQRKYTMHLIGGVGFFIFSMFFGVPTGAYDWRNDYPCLQDCPNSYAEEDHSRDL